MDSNLNAENHMMAIQPKWTTLHFPPPKLELQFRTSFFRNRLALVRFTIPCLLCAFALFGLTDSVTANSGAGSDVDLRRALRYGVQCPLIVLYLLLSYTGIYQHYVQIISSIMCLMIGVANIALAILGGAPDHGPQMLYFFVVFFFLQLRVLYATVVCWILYVFYLVGTTTFVPAYNRYLLAAGYMAISIVCLMFAAYFTEYWTRINFIRSVLLETEQEKTNDLLSTLLPDQVTEMILAGHTLIAQEIPHVSILFSDIVGFTAYSASIKASDLVQFLNQLYTTFDHLTIVHEVLKIETIGDAYFVASGVFDRRPDHALSLADLAFDMAYILSQFKSADNYHPQMRIGMHCGKVIAGVVGIKVPRYHLFGESVTFASLMESTGVPSRIQVSSAMHRELYGHPGYLMEFRSDQHDPEADQKRRQKVGDTYFLYTSNIHIPDHPLQAPPHLLNDHTQSQTLPLPPIFNHHDESSNTNYQIPLSYTNNNNNQHADALSSSSSTSCLCSRSLPLSQHNQHQDGVMCPCCSSSSMSSRQVHIHVSHGNSNRESPPSGPGSNPNTSTISNK